jgi:hypothetical protein
LIILWRFCMFFLENLILVFASMAGMPADYTDKAERTDYNSTNFRNHKFQNLFLFYGN